MSHTKVQGVESFPFIFICSDVTVQYSTVQCKAWCGPKFFVFWQHTKLDLLLPGANNFPLVYNITDSGNNKFQRLPYLKWLQFILTFDGSPTYTGTPRRLMKASSSSVSRFVAPMTGTCFLSTPIQKSYQNLLGANRCQQRTSVFSGQGYIALLSQVSIYQNTKEIITHFKEII